ncbi:MAG TPA: glycosyltransferase 87 family protein [Terriglobales bacterium]|nr:glycosyltransferase 87 family protein [Terriglobales bacterium]
MRRLAKPGVVVLLCAIALALSGPLVRRRPLIDFVEYWTAAHLYLAGENPYSLERMFHEEQFVGFRGPEPLMLVNPPWFLPVLLPLGAMKSYFLARAMWFWASIALLFFAADRLWSIYGGPAPARLVPLALVLLFFPNWRCVSMGQLAPLLLLGIVGLLYFERRGSLFTAGSFLAVTTVKPHLFYLVWLAALLWSIQKREWRLLAGAVTAVAAAAAVAVAVNHAVFGQYISLIRSGYTELFASSVGGLLRYAFGRQHAWLQFAPMLPGVAWLLWYWRKLGSHWSWTEQLPVLLTTSVLTAAYGWVNDQPVLMLPLIAAAVQCAHEKRLRRLASDWFFGMSLVSFAVAGYPSVIGMLVMPLGILLYFATVAKRRNLRDAGRPQELSRAAA